MAAIITDEFRKQLAASIVTENSSTDALVPDYYIGIGKTDPWTDLLTGESVTNFAPSVPDGSIREREEVKENLMALIKVPTDKAVRVVPRITWATSKIYKVYDPGDPTCFIPTSIGGTSYEPCYVVHNDKLWVCLYNKATGVNQGLGAVTTSSDEPASTDAANLYAGSISGIANSNYTWAYVQDVDNASIAFNTNQFVKVRDTDLPSGTAKTNAEDATGGLAYGIKVTNIGSGYTTDPTITIVGNKGDVTNATFTRSNSTITFIEFDGKSGGTDYTDASVVISGGGGTGAEARVIIAPPNGFGFNSADDLPSYYVGFEASLEGDLEGDAAIIAYRQLSLLRGLESVVRKTDEGADSGGTTKYAEVETLDALKYFVCASTEDLTTITSQITPGDIIEDNATGAKAFVDHIDTSGSNDRVYFHQNNNDLVTKESFSTSGTIKIVTRAGGTTVDASIAYDSIGNGEYQRKTGEVIFYENRTPITRSSQQTEEIKLVIQL
jgi:hypothetical protein